MAKRKSFIIQPPNFFPVYLRLLLGQPLCLLGAAGRVFSEFRQTFRGFRNFFEEANLFELRHLVDGLVQVRLGRNLLVVFVQWPML